MCFEQEQHIARQEAGPNSMKNLLTDEDSMEDTRTLERPSRVTTAVHMLYLSLGFPVAGAFLQCVLPEGNRSEGLVVLGSLPLPLLLYCMIRRGKDWARITFVIMSVLNVAALVDRSLINPPLFDSREISLLSLGIAEVCIDLAALALLFQPDSSDWFRAMSGPPKNRFKNMLGSLRNTDQPVLSYVWRAWLIALVPEHGTWIDRGTHHAEQRAVIRWASVVHRFGNPSDRSVGRDSFHVANPVDTDADYRDDIGGCCGFGRVLGAYAFIMCACVGLSSCVAVLRFFPVLSGVEESVDGESYCRHRVGPHLPEPGALIYHGAGRLIPGLTTSRYVRLVQSPHSLNSQGSRVPARKGRS